MSFFNETSNPISKHAKRLFIACLFVGFIPLTSFTPGYLSYGVKTIVIDAGHGGHDPGCLGASSNEKNVALNIALKVGKHIEDNYKDVKVVYTRKTDKFVELHERANIANTNKADLFICIHCNSGAATAFGVETFVMGLHRSKDNLSVANRENQAILKEDDYKSKYDGFDPNSAESHIMFSMFQSAFMDHSLSFADKVQKQFKKIGRHDRGVKQAGFLVLYKTTMPSVLIETGFLTNKDEEKTFLGTEKGQEQAAMSIYKAFKEYKNEVEGSNTTDEPEIKKEEVKKDSTQIKDINTTADKNENNPKNEKIENAWKTAEGIILKVQFAASATPIDIKPENFKGLNDVSQLRAGETFRYMTGEERSIEKIKLIQEDVVKRGYKDAFIVAFKNGERISLSDALKELK